MQQHAPKQPKQHFTRPNLLYRIFHRTARTLYRGTEFMRVNDALESMYRKGYEAGQKARPPEVYSDFCPLHPGTKRQILRGEPWLAVCWPCYMEAHVETPITCPWPAVSPPQQQQQTGPIAAAPYVPGTVFQQARKQMHPDGQAGPHTIKHRTINLRGMQP